MFILISAVLAIIQYRRNVTFIAQLMGVSWGALAGAFLAPFLYGLYMKRTSLASVWVSFIFGAGIMTLNLFFRSAFPPFLQSPINCGAFAMVAGLIIVPVVSFLTPRPDQRIIDFAFSGYNRTVTVTQREALGKSEEI